MIAKALRTASTGRSNTAANCCVHESVAPASRRRPEFFLATGATNLGLIKMRSTQAHSGLWCPEIAQLRPQIVPWSTLCRADWVRNDLVLTMRGWLLRHYHPVLADFSRPRSRA